VRKTPSSYLLNWIVILALVVGVQMQAMPIAVASDGAQATVSVAKADFGNPISCAARDMAPAQCIAACTVVSTIGQFTSMAMFVTRLAPRKWPFDSYSSLTVTPDTAPPRFT
jgi:hypothetical protein